MTERERIEDYDLRKLGIPFTLQPKGMWKLEPTARRMYDLLMDFQEPIKEDRDVDTWDYIGKCTLTNREMAELLEVDTRAIKRGLTKLEESGFVTIISGRGESVKYINNRPARNIQLSIEAELEERQFSRRLLSKSYWKEHKGEFKEAEEEEQTPSVASGEDHSKRQRALFVASESAICGLRVGTNTTNIVNNINTSLDEPKEEVAESKLEGSGNLLVFDPAGVITTPYSPPPIDELENCSLPPVQVSGSEIKSPAELKKLKGVERLIHDPTNATASDIILYFEHKFKEVYNTPCSSKYSKSPQALATLKNGFMNKYPVEQWTKLVDDLILLYEHIPIDRTKYPCPSTLCLTQPWLINLIIAERQKKDEVVAFKKESEIAKEVAETKVKIDWQFLDYVETVCDSATLKLLMIKRDELILNAKDCSSWINNLTIPGPKLKELIINA